MADLSLDGVLSPSTIACSSSTKESCNLLLLPLELRFEIYHHIFQHERRGPKEAARKQMTPRARDRERRASPGPSLARACAPKPSPVEHTTHFACKCLFDEKDPILHVNSNWDDDNHQKWGIAIPKPFALLQTCRQIRAEATKEMGSGIVLEVATHSCLRTNDPESDAEGWTYMWKKYRGNKLRQILEKTILKIEIEEGASSRRANCWISRAYEEESNRNVRRFPMLLKYLFTQVKRIEIEVSWHNYDGMRNAVKRLRNVVDNLDAECSALECITLNGSHNRSPFLLNALERKQGWRDLQQEWVYKFKRNAMRMFKGMQPSEEKVLLYEQIKQSFAEIPKPRRLCDVKEIINSRTVKKETDESEVDLQEVVEYRVKREGHHCFNWESEKELLPKWKEMLVTFHAQQKKMGRNMPKAAAIGPLSQINCK